MQRNYDDQFGIGQAACARISKEYCEAEAAKLSEKLAGTVPPYMREAYENRLAELLVSIATANSVIGAFYAH